ncbi:MAG TPA: 50S ribosomal protein L11 methyltransferase [Cyclobacteriaceae bacterium]|nr:50S ribosomal protein L11 methyltransferase [Cyclobacteriaceae bacterium]
MFYTRLQVVCDPDFSEILMAEIAEAGFDTFLETENGFEAYAENEKFEASLVDSIQKKYGHVSPLLFFRDQIQKQNWNEEWERNVEPIFVDDRCWVHADFHKMENLPVEKQKKYPYEIIITPKMSFGTGHHQTTYLMLKNQMQIDHQNKLVMDAGCGTAILSIMAAKLGAREVQAFDIDEWSVTNGNENAEVNGCKNIHIRMGKIAELRFHERFDLILANINRNILLDEMKHYSNELTPGGQLLLSGFYENDIPDLKRKAGEFGLSEIARDSRETWACLLLKKNI